MALYRTAFKQQTFNNDYTLQYDFNHVDFSNAMGAAVLPLPFALSVMVEHNRPHPLYITVKYELNNQMVTLSDREHISGVIAAETGGSSIFCVVGPASVPSLAYIPANITKISIIVTRDGELGGVSSICKIGLQFEDPYAPQGTAPLIGSSKALIDDASLTTDTYSGSNCAPGTTTLNTNTIVYPFRTTILTATLETWPTPSYPGDLEIYLNVNNQTLLHVASSDTEYRAINITSPILLGYNAEIEIIVLNNNTTQTYKVNVHITYASHL